MSEQTEILEGLLAQLSFDDKIEFLLKLGLDLEFSTKLAKEVENKYALKDPTPDLFVD